MAACDTLPTFALLDKAFGYLALVCGAYNFYQSLFQQLFSKDFISVHSFESGIFFFSSLRRFA